MIVKRIGINFTVQFQFMKRNQLIILGVFLILVAGIYFAIISNAKKPVDVSKSENKTEYVAVKEVVNKTRNVQLASYGQVTPNASLDVSMEVQGKLTRGNITMKPGVKFSKGQILYRVDNEEAYYTLAARKIQFSNMILNILPDMDLDFPTERKKWNNFMADIKPGESLPGLPEINSNKEKMFVTSRGILAEYYNLKSAEIRLGKYFYVAPFSGTVIEIFSEVGAIVNPGGRIATIAKTGDYELKIPINLNNLSSFKNQTSTIFTDATGNEVGNGKILRISDVINKNTQSVDVYYSIKPKKEVTIYNGMFLNAKINENVTMSSMTIPRSAINQGKVMVLANNKLEERIVTEVGSKPDSVFVTGLRDKEMVLYELIESPDKTKKYIGVER